MSDYIVLASGIEADSDTNHGGLSGSGVIAIAGTFDGATVKIIFKTRNSAGEFVEMPETTALTFTSAPEPAVTRFPLLAPVIVRVSGAGAGTNLRVAVHRVF